MRSTIYVPNSEILYADEKRIVSLLRSFLKKGNQSDSSPDRLAHTGSERLLRSGYVGSISYDRGNVNLSSVPLPSVVEIGEISSNEMGEGSAQSGRPRFCQAAAGADRWQALDGQRRRGSVS